MDIVRGDLLDLALLVIAIAFAISGYRQGFIVGSLSFIGFVGGAVLGAEFGPAISRAIVGGQTQQDVVAVVLLVVFAIVGQFVFSSVGAYVRQAMTSRSSTVIDSIGGAAVSVLSMLLIAWAIGSVLTASSFQGVVAQVDDSLVLTTMDKVMPSQAKTMFGEFRRLLASGPYPQVFGGLGAEAPLTVEKPDGQIIHSASLQQDEPSIVKVVGTAPSCGRRIEGSGFVISPDHVLTNAHVVAGVTDGPTVYTTGGATLSATVVLFDPRTDIAVLYVPNLDLAPLRFAGPASTGANAIVAGYPLDHPFTAVAARIGGVQRATAPDIYQQSGLVTRQIYALRALIQPGNSGGPLIDPGTGDIYGVVFAAAVGVPDVGYALTAVEVSGDAQAGANYTTPVSTDGCA